MCAKPRKFSMDEILKLAPLEERIYRHRCVEAWSIVVPWVGYSLSALLKQVEPTPKAKFVAFESYYDLSQMPEARYAGIPLPYVEGLRLDEAMHPLTMLTVGMYGETLPPQDGAPVRLTVPWKYGFKSAKSLVKIKLVDKQPPNTWNIANPSGVRLLLQRESRTSIIRAGARRRSGAWASSASALPSCSTAMATRWPACTTAWT